MSVTFNQFKAFQFQEFLIDLLDNPQTAHKTVASLWERQGTVKQRKINYIISLIHRDFFHPVELNKIEAIFAETLYNRAYNTKGLKRLFFIAQGIKSHTFRQLIGEQYRKAGLKCVHSAKEFEIADSMFEKAIALQNLQALMDYANLWKNINLNNSLDKIYSVVKRSLEFPEINEVLIFLRGYMSILYTLAKKENAGAASHLCEFAHRRVPLAMFYMGLFLEESGAFDKAREIYSIIPKEDKHAYKMAKIHSQRLPRSIQPEQV